MHLELILIRNIDSIVRSLHQTTLGQLIFWPNEVDSWLPLDRACSVCPTPHEPSYTVSFAGRIQSSSDRPHHLVPASVYWWLRIPDSDLDALGCALRYRVIRRPSRHYHLEVKYVQSQRGLQRRNRLLGFLAWMPVMFGTPQLLRHIVGF